VPWGVHDEAGFTGDLDLAAFLDEVQEAGMYALVRPGPHINAELTYFGFPERIVADRAMQAISGRGTPVWLPAPPRMFPVPSYASAAFRAEVGAWFQRVAEIVAPRRWPEGPVAAVQVDNEFQMFFRLGAYDQDYHPDALTWWREFAGDEEPPRAWNSSDASRCVRWVRFKEEYLRRSLAWLSEAITSAGMDEIARFHNAPPSDPTFVTLPGAAEAIGGVCGMDFYHRAADYGLVRRRARYVAGTGKPLPFAPEVGAGGPLWLPSMTEDDQRSVLLQVLAAGVRAFTLYMAVDRDRWYGAPISTEGEPLAPAAWLRRLLGVLREAEFTSLRRRADVAIVLTRAEARWAVASSALDPLSPVLGEFLDLGRGGFSELSTDDGARQHRHYFIQCVRALDLGDIPYAIVDEELGAEELSRYRVLIMPTLDRVDRATWRALHTAAAAGSRVVIGPNKPAFDEMGEPLDPHDAALPPGAGLIRPASIDDTDGLAHDLAELAIAVDEHLDDDFTAPDHPRVHCSLFEDSAGAPRLLFVGNEHDEPVTAEVLVPPGVALRDPLADGAAPIAPRAGAARVELGAWGLRLFEVLAREGTA
jgi:beta-galactosidase